MTQDNQHNEMPKDTVEETAKELRLAFYKRHSKNKYPKRMVDILDSYDIEVKQALQSQAEQYKREKGEMVREIQKMIEYESGFDRRSYEQKNNDFDEGCIKCADNLSRRIDTIAQKYGVDLSE